MPQNIIEIIVRAATEGEGALKEVDKDVTGLDKKFDSLGANLAKTAAKIGATVISVQQISQAIKASITTFANFDDMMRQVAAITGASDEQFKQLTESARLMGETTRYTATQSAEALKYLSMAGYDAKESMAALPAVLQLAAATSTDLAQSADLLTNVMAGYGIQVEDLARVNDILVATTTKSNTNLVELANGFTYVGPVAKSLGLEIEEVSATLGKLASAGYKSEKGGAALRNIMVALAAPTSKAEKIMKQLGATTEEMGLDLSVQAQALKKYGLEVKDSTGNMRPFVDILGDFEDAIKDIPGNVERTAVASELFGKRAGPAMAALVNQGSDAVRELTEKIKQSGGIAEKVAVDMEAGLGGAMRRFKSVAESVAIDLGKELAPALIDLSERGIALLNTFKETALIQFSGVLTDLMAMASAAGEVNKELRFVEAILNSIALAVAAVRDGMKIITYAALEITLALAGAKDESDGWTNTILDGLKLIVPGLDALSKAIPGVDSEFVKSLQNIQDEMAQSDLQLRNLLDKQKDFWTGTKDAAKDSAMSFVNFRHEIEGLNKGLLSNKVTLDNYTESMDQLKVNIEAAFKAGMIGLKEKNALMNLAIKTTDKAKDAEKGFSKEIEKGTAKAKEQGEAITESGEGMKKTFQGIDEIFKELGVEARNMGTNITTTIQNSVAALDQLSTQADVTGEVIVEAFSNLAGKAKTKEDIELLQDKMRELSQTGKLSLEQISEATEILDQSMVDLIQSTQEGKESLEKIAEAEKYFAEVSQEAAASSGEFMAAAEGLEDVLWDAFQGGAISADEYNNKLDELDQKLREYTQSSEDATEATEGSTEAQKAWGQSQGVTIKQIGDGVLKYKELSSVARETGGVASELVDIFEHFGNRLVLGAEEAGALEAALSGSSEEMMRAAEVMKNNAEIARKFGVDLTGLNRSNELVRASSELMAAALHKQAVESAQAASDLKSLSLETQEYLGLANAAQSAVNTFASDIELLTWQLQNGLSTQKEYNEAVKDLKKRFAEAVEPGTDLYRAVMEAFTGFERGELSIDDFTQALRDMTRPGTEAIDILNDIYDALAGHSITTGAAAAAEELEKFRVTVKNTKTDSEMLKSGIVGISDGLRTFKENTAESLEGLEEMYNRARDFEAIQLEQFAPALREDFTMPTREQAGVAQTVYQDYSKFELDVNVQGVTQEWFNRELVPYLEDWQRRRR